MSADAKASLRREMLAKRESLSIEYIAHAGKNIAEKLKDALATRELVIPRSSRDDNVRTIALYHPTRGEVDTLQAAAVLHEAGYTLALPCVTKASKILTFRTWNPADALVIGSYNIQQPAETAAIVTPDILIVPLLAFDNQGFRLGYGGGYYDATIAHLKKNNPKLHTIGLAYDFQHVDSLPREAHDVPLDSILFTIP